MAGVNIDVSSCKKKQKVDILIEIDGVSDFISESESKCEIQVYFKIVVLID